MEVKYRIKIQSESSSTKTKIRRNGYDTANSENQQERAKIL